MSEKENNTNEQKAKICQLGLWALLLSISGVFTFGITSVVGIVLALVADRQISKSKGGLRGRVYTTLAIITAVIILARFVIPVRPIHRETAKRMLCRFNLSKLGKGMLIYTEDYDGQYPTADKWCDLLVDLKMEPEYFICRNSDAKIGESSYALNKNIVGKKASEIHLDTVLLFEAEKGWNQVGGPELLTLENHNGEGCSVLFGDLHVEFIKKERIADLEWRVEEKDESTE